MIMVNNNLQMQHIHHMNKSKHKTKPNRGFTLIEIMIAMTLGLTLISIVVRFYVSAQHSYEMQMGLVRLQENARAAMFELMEVIQQARPGELKAKRQTQNTLSLSSSDALIVNNILYFVADTGRKTKVGNAMFALYRKALTKDELPGANEVVEGIKQLTFRFGVKHSGLKNINFVAANKVKDWSQVIVVHIKIMIMEDYWGEREWQTYVRLKPGGAKQKA